MIAIKLFSVFATFFVAQVYAMEVNCGSDHKAYVWNCQTLLDNWTLDDNTFYSPATYNCVWSGMTKYGAIACKYLENDSCTLVGTYSPSVSGYNGAGYTGADLKQFVQTSINQCTSNSEVSSSISGNQELGQGGLCLCNHGSATSCA